MGEEPDAIVPLPSRTAPPEGREATGAKRRRRKRRTGWKDGAKRGALKEGWRKKKKRERGRAGHNPSLAPSEGAGRFRGGSSPLRSLKKREGRLMVCFLFFRDFCGNASQATCDWNKKHMFSDGRQSRFMALQEQETSRSPTTRIPSLSMSGVSHHHSFKTLTSPPTLFVCFIPFFSPPSPCQTTVVPFLFLYQR